MLNWKVRRGRKNTPAPNDADQRIVIAHGLAKVGKRGKRRSPPAECRHFPQWQAITATVPSNAAKARSQLDCDAGIGVA
jgi:hypothetical protein